jgi:hypothetical protein
MDLYARAQHGESISPFNAAARGDYINGLISLAGFIGGGLKLTFEAAKAVDVVAADTSKSLATLDQVGTFANRAAMVGVGLNAAGDWAFNLRPNWSKMTTAEHHQALSGLIQNIVMLAAPEVIQRLAQVYAGAPVNAAAVSLHHEADGSVKFVPGSIINGQFVVGDNTAWVGDNPPSKFIAFETSSNSQGALVPEAIHIFERQNDGSYQKVFSKVYSTREPADASSNQSLADDPVAANPDGSYTITDLSGAPASTAGPAGSTEPGLEGILIAPPAAGSAPPVAAGSFTTAGAAGGAAPVPAGSLVTASAAPAASANGAEPLSSGSPATAGAPVLGVPRAASVPWGSFATVRSSGGPGPVAATAGSTAGAMPALSIASSVGIVPLAADPLATAKFVPGASPALTQTLSTNGRAGGAAPLAAGAPATAGAITSVAPLPAGPATSGAAIGAATVAASPVVAESSAIAAGPSQSGTSADLPANAATNVNGQLLMPSGADANAPQIVAAPCQAGLGTPAQPAGGEGSILAPDLEVPVATQTVEVVLTSDAGNSAAEADKATADSEWAGADRAAVEAQSDRTATVAAAVVEPRGQAAAQEGVVAGSASGSAGPQDTAGMLPPSIAAAKTAEPGQPKDAANTAFARLITLWRDACLRAAAGVYLKTSANGTASLLLSSVGADGAEPGLDEIARDGRGKQFSDQQEETIDQVLDPEDLSLAAQLAHLVDTEADDMPLPIGSELGPASASGQARGDSDARLPDVDDKPVADAALLVPDNTNGGSPGSRGDETDEADQADDQSVTAAAYLAWIYTEPESANAAPW